MIVTCPECQIEYRLDPKLLGAQGRMVRCAACRHTWFQAHVAVKDISLVMADAPAAEADIAFDQKPDTPAESFEVMLQQIVIAEPPSAKIPDGVKPKPLDFNVPAPVTYKVMGMGPGQFGFLTFLMLAFISASALFLAKAPLVRALPGLSGLYRTLGFEVKAPGEGLRFGALTAENRMDAAGRALAVEAKLSNTANETLPYPVLRVTLKSAYGAVLKEWTLDADGKPPLASGASVNVKSEFRDAPEGGGTAEIRVVGK